MFFTFFLWLRGAAGGGGGPPKGFVHNLLMKFFTPGSPTIELFETYFFFDTVITQNDHPRYVKHVLGRIFVFFTFFLWLRGAAGGGGVLPRDSYTTCLCSFSPRAAQKSKFSKLIFF